MCKVQKSVSICVKYISVSMHSIYLLTDWYLRIFYFTAHNLTCHCLYEFHIFILYANCDTAYVTFYTNERNTQKRLAMDSFLIVILLILNQNHFVDLIDLIMYVCLMFPMLCAQLIGRNFEDISLKGDTLPCFTP